MKQRTKALLAGVISGAAFAGLVGGLILWLPSYKQKKEMEAIKPVETAAPIIEEPEATPDPAAEEAAQRAKYADLIARNPEFAGWIEIPGVDIDLPILQTTDNYFYLSIIIHFASKASKCSVISGSEGLGAKDSTILNSLSIKIKRGIYLICQFTLNPSLSTELN